MENCSTKISRCARLVERLQQLMSGLDFHDLHIHHNIDEFYYLTKVEELRILMGLCEGEKKRLEAVIQLMDSKYVEVFHQWRKDVRWLCSYQNRRSVRSR
jgi:hypothetical protein